MDDVLGFGGETLFVNTKPGRARAVCSYLHDRLIAKRRGTLDAMKEGFLWAADLRPALQLFSAAELAATAETREEAPSGAERPPNKRGRLKRGREGGAVKKMGRDGEVAARGGGARGAGVAARTS